MPKQESEEYLEAVLDLSGPDALVRISALAERVGVSPASATEAVQRLAREGMVDYLPYRGVTLNPKGRQAAGRLKRKHRLLEVMLVKLLGLAPRGAHQEACQLEHSLSDRTEQALCRSLKGPLSCPHGQPIPLCDADTSSCAACLAAEDALGTTDRAGAIALAALPPNASGRIVFIRGGKGVVGRLCDQGLVPGTVVRMVRAAPLAGPVEVRVRGCDLALGRQIAGRIFVTEQVGR
jgi:DtxR family transcriptional regulator, Mn-dependent transcriptional regulator